MLFGKRHYQVHLVKAIVHEAHRHPGVAGAHLLNQAAHKHVDIFLRGALTAVEQPKYDSNAKGVQTLRSKRVKHTYDRIRYIIRGTIVNRTKILLVKIGE